MTKEEKRAVGLALSTVMNQTYASWWTIPIMVNVYQCRLCKATRPLADVGDQYDIEHTPTCPIRMFGIDVIWREERDARREERAT